MHTLHWNHEKLLLIVLLLFTFSLRFVCKTDMVFLDGSEKNRSDLTSSDACEPWGQRDAFFMTDWFVLTKNILLRIRAVTRMLKMRHMVMNVEWPERIVNGIEEVSAHNND